MKLDESPKYCTCGPSAVAHIKSCWTGNVTNTQDEAIRSLIEGEK